MTRQNLCAVALSLGLTAWPVTSGAQTAETPARPVAVALDLFSGDKNSKGFADALTAAITGDNRFTLVTPLPADGLKIVMNEGLSVQDTDMQTNAAYDVVLTLGNGKYIDEKRGLCDLARLTMCGRVVAQDSFDAYQAYMARHRTR
jgi:hypothetical protein